MSRNLLSTYMGSVRGNEKYRNHTTDLDLLKDFADFVEESSISIYDAGLNDGKRQIAGSIQASMSWVVEKAESLLQMIRLAHKEDELQRDFLEIENTLLILLEELYIFTEEE